MQASSKESNGVTISSTPAMYRRCYLIHNMTIKKKTDCSAPEFASATAPNFAATIWTRRPPRPIFQPHLPVPSSSPIFQSQGCYSILPDTTLLKIVNLLQHMAIRADCRISFLELLVSPPSLNFLKLQSPAFTSDCEETIDLGIIVRRQYAALSKSSIPTTTEVVESHDWQGKARR